MKRFVTLMAVVVLVTGLCMAKCPQSELNPKPQIQLFVLDRETEIGTWCYDIELGLITDTPCQMAKKWTEEMANKGYEVEIVNIEDLFAEPPKGEFSHLTSEQLEKKRDEIRNKLTRMYNYPEVAFPVLIIGNKMQQGFSSYIYDKIVKREE